MWDTFPTTDGTATEGVTTSLEERVRLFEDACRSAGRDPEGIRRSVWVGSEPFEDPAAFSQFVDLHRSLGFTDLIAALPPPDRWSVVREIAASLFPRLRSGGPAAHHLSATIR
jgi:hypothetical protein